MTRLRQLLSSTATRLLAVGGTLAAAIVWAALQMGVDCNEWMQMTAPYRDEQRFEWAYITEIDGAENPDAIEGPTEEAPDRLLGACAAGECVVGAPQCEAGILRYPYVCSKLQGGWRACAIRAPKYLDHGWKILATAEPASYHWLGFGKKALQNCLGFHTPAQCRDMLEEIANFKLPSGTLCTNGHVLTDASTPCPYAEALADPANTCIYPKVTDRGASSWLTWCETDLTDEELDE